MEQTNLVTHPSLTCKNCRHTLHSKDNFCSNCAAKIVSGRITFKNLVYDLFNNTLGWDNKYFYTIKMLLTRPGLVLSEYLNGTRKKYVQPFAFLALGMAIAIFVFNTFDEQFIRVNQEFQKSQMDWMAEKIGGPYKSAEFQKEQLENSGKMVKLQLKYLNFLVVLLLPIYSFIAFLVYGKPYNYGEHIIVNSYVQGLSFLSISIFFVFSLVTHPLFYASNSILLIVFYTYAYGRLYKLSIGQSLLKVFMFFTFIIVSLLMLGILSYLIGFLGAKVLK